MKQYHDLIKAILDNGEDTDDRTGVGTKSLFGYQMRFNLQEGFPAVTTKKLAWKSVVAELLWFLEGSTDERRLAELTYGKHRTQLVDKKTIWTANADNQGVALGYANSKHSKELGPVYGSQWRNFGTTEGSYISGTDQIKWLLEEIKTNPESRRLVVSAWSVNQLPKMSLPPCHLLIQFKVLNGKLSCQLYQRSADTFLGVPFNIASYALLTHIIAKETGLEVGDFVHTIGDAHIYNNHLDQARELIQRTPYDLPTLEISNDFSLQGGLNYRFQSTDAGLFTLKDYESHPAITAPMAV